MTHFIPENDKFKSPEYWDGLDIYDEELFRHLEWTPFTRLNKKQFKAARQSLMAAQQNVKKGNSVDIRYELGTEFNPSEQQLEDGTVIILKTEELSHHVYTDSDRRWTKNESRDAVTPPISRPFSEYWAATRISHTDADDQPNSAGYEELFYWNDNIRYSRLLNWGVIVTLEKTKRAIQPFSFNGERNGEIDNYYKDFPMHRPVLPLPVELGGIELSSLDLTSKDMPINTSCIIDVIRRINAIDVVYLGAGKKERKKSKLRQLGNRALPRLAPNI